MKTIKPMKLFSKEHLPLEELILAPATQIGANTIGCKINGKILIL